MDKEFCCKRTMGFRKDPSMKIGCIFIMLLIALALSLSGCSGKSSDIAADSNVASGIAPVSDSAQKIPARAVPSSPEDITLTTEDKIDLRATYRSADTERAFILTHMLDSDRHSYDDFSSQLYGASIAIDLRGHGDSDLDWKEFGHADFNRMTNDVKGAVAFLRNEGYTDIVLVGASIGANIVMNYAAQDNETSAVILLSPGMDYKGVSISSAIKQYTGRLLIVVSEQDNYAFSSGKEILASSASPKRRYMQLAGKAHGTEILKDETAFAKIKEWSWQSGG